MKEITAVIRMNRVNETKKALADAGFCGMHAMKVQGRGKTPVEFQVLNEISLQEEYGGIIQEQLNHGGRLIPKRLFTLLVKDEDADRAVDVILQVNSRGQRGDGKIFVSPVTGAARIRTGESGPDAI